MATISNQELVDLIYRAIEMYSSSRVEPLTIYENMHILGGAFNLDEVDFALILAYISNLLFLEYSINAEFDQYDVNIQKFDTVNLLASYINTVI